MLTGEHVVILLGLSLGRSDPHLRGTLGVTESTLGEAKEVAALSGIFDPAGRRVLRVPLFRMLHDAGRFVYPVVEQGVGPGVLTGLDAVADLERRSPGLRLVGNVHRRLVGWPAADGRHVVRRITPLHPGCPAVAAADDDWYRLIALTDALRLDGMRERTRALEILQQRAVGAA